MEISQLSDAGIESKDLKQTDGEQKYKEYLSSEHWKVKREERLEIDKYACQFCGARDNLSVHHLNYENLSNEDAERDLITLCGKCHKQLHEFIEVNTPRFKEVTKEYSHQLNEAAKPIIENYTIRQAQLLAEVIAKFDKNQWKNIQKIVQIVLRKLQIQWYANSALSHPGGTRIYIHQEAIRLAALRRRADSRTQKHPSWK